MIYIHIWILIFIFLPTSILCAELCGDKRTVIGAVGGDVILPLKQTRIKDVSWVNVNGGTHFATTKPGGDIDVRDNRYEGRLDGTADGSLRFTKLTREDQGDYRANIRTDPGNKQCEQQYDLRVFSILCAELCGDKRTVIGAVGGDVILPLKQTRIKDVSWVNVNGGTHFATTKPGGDIQIRDNRYEGRLYGTADGSLRFTKLTREDHGDYIANILTDPGNKQCEQQYDLRVFRKLLSEDIEILPTVTRNGTCGVILFCTVNGSGVNITWSRSDSTEINVINGLLHVTDINNIFTCTAQNPVSTVSRTVIPMSYCQEALQTMSTRGNSLLYGVFIAKGFAVLIVGLFLCINLLLTRKQGT
ncbi:SLAM family member 5-like [Pelobates fuscus]|uniref:SLAM family member 5-like n=1 Tax=Pelobates fuscus TaxID=191477 RepID=UPI002FE4A146